MELIYDVVREYVENSRGLKIDGGQVIVSTQSEYCSTAVVIPVFTESRVRVSLQYCSSLPNIEDLKENLDSLIGRGDDTRKVLSQNNPPAKVRAFLQILDESLMGSLSNHWSEDEDTSEEASDSENEWVCKHCGTKLEFVERIPHWQSYYTCRYFDRIDNPFCDNYVQR
tara:strand:+ start:436 stop:942 length:507 start_codon:yes stop_codon:yes gene_type:complete